MALSQDVAPVLIQAVDDMNRTCSQLERMTNEMGLIAKSIRVAHRASSRKRMMLDAAKKELKAKREKLEKLKKDVRNSFTDKTFAMRKRLSSRTWSQLKLSAKVHDQDCTTHRVSLIISPEVPDTHRSKRWAGIWEGFELPPELQALNKREAEQSDSSYDAAGCTASNSIERLIGLYVDTNKN